jgi:hypothetical protein
MSGRGRGKRVANKVVETPTDDGQQEKPIKKTTRKKQFPVVAIITPDGIEGSLIPEVKRPLIVHFPIHSKDIQTNDMPLTYDPMPPTDAMPYDSNADNPFYEGVENIESHTVVAQQATVTQPETNNVTNSDTNTNTNTQMSEQNNDYYNMKTTLLVQFKDSTETKTIPLTSDAACFWCCHTFNHRPVVLPIRDTGEHLEVTGNFCCPECASSYLFDMRQDSHTRWEQLALLYRVYGEMCNGKIHPAPSKNALKLFGGNLSIQEYRNLIRSYNVRIDIHLPPMVSILSTMDTKPIDFYDASLTKGVTETVKERLQKAEEVLRLRRTKPLKAWESTLDACISLKIKP